MENANDSLGDRDLSKVLLDFATTLDQLIHKNMIAMDPLLHDHMIAAVEATDTALCFVYELLRQGEKSE